MNKGDSASIQINKKLGQMSLQNLVKTIHEKHGPQTTVPEDVIARDFFKNYQFTIPISTNDIITRLSPEINFLKRTIPGDADGIFMAIDGFKPCIVYDPAGRPPAYTCLHEIREVMNHYFCTISRDSEMLEKDKERRCEKFAALCLMPSFEFCLFATKANADIAVLKKLFDCSYMTICIRMKEVMNYDFCIKDDAENIVLQSNEFKKAARETIKERQYGKYTILLSIPPEKPSDL